MYYDYKGKTASGQLVFGCKHIPKVSVAIAGGDGTHPLLIEYTNPLSSNVGAIAFSRRTLVFWCRNCYSGLGGAMKEVRAMAAMGLHQPLEGSGHQVMDSDSNSCKRNWDPHVEEV